MFLPARNAILTAVTTPAGGGPVDDFDTATTPEPVTKWAGQSDAWVSRKFIRVDNGGRLDHQQETTVSIPAALPAEVGDTLHLKIEGIAYEWEVRSVWRSYTIAAQCVVNH